jgi:hypothetical protein
MKTTPLIVALALFSVTASHTLASDTPTKSEPTKGREKKAKAPVATAPHKEKKVYLTGSYIKKDVRRAGVITNGPDVVYVLDQTTIERSGGADLSHVLMRSGFGH